MMDSVSSLDPVPKDTSRNSALPEISIPNECLVKKISEGEGYTYPPHSAEVMALGSNSITTPNQHMPGQRLIRIRGGPNTSLVGVSAGFYVLIPTGQYRHEPPFGLPTREILRVSISSSSSASWARQQLETCLSSHVKCSSSRNQSFLPARLVDVRPFGLEGNVKLVQGLDLPSDTRYAALSYVWGDSKLQEHIKTTRSTLASHFNKIIVSSLPETLRNAITFTRDLGLDFLWLDSLCIIQNDPDEWAYEAERMYDVYKNSFVMLGALWGRDCDSGLFRSCAEWQSKPIATLRMGQDTWPLHVSQEHEILQLNHTWLGWEPPLLTRAWCFQERLVSSRCIFFGRGEVIFGCYEGISCECGISYGVVGYPSSNQAETLPSGNTGHHSPPLGQEHGLRWVNLDPQKAWRQVVEEYSSRLLTSEKDRFTTIGAVAEQLSYVRRREQYLAGLWSATLLADLCWWIPRPNRYKGPSLGDKTTIPSWSWASRARKVEYEGADMLLPTAEIIQVSCIYKNDNPFGVLLESKMILRGRIMRWWSRTAKVRSTYDARGGRILFGSKGTSIHVGLVSEDFVPWRKIPPGTFLFELGRWSEDNLLGVFLVLKCKDEETLVFSRQGFLSPTSLPVESIGMEDIRDLSRKFAEHSVIRDCPIV